MFTTDYKEIIAQIESIDPKEYAQTRNFLDGAVTRLSPYITRGVITLPQVRDMVLQKHSAADAYKFIQELAWREYFQKTWIARGDDIFTDIRFEQLQVERQGMPQSVVDADTGVLAVDQGIKDLYETGYMHNHMRMTVASLVCNLGHYAWNAPAQWMYYHLLDSDPASNMLSWQWVAGTSISKQYSTSQDLVNYFTRTKQTGTILDFDRDAFAQQKTPAQLLSMQELDLRTELPQSDNINFASAEKVLLYHPWHLNPQWRKDESGLRVLLLQPSVFEKLPVSKKVLDFIITLAQKNIEDIQIFVGEMDDLFAQTNCNEVITIEHPTVKHDQVVIDQREWLFPQVNGYYKSFFAFWKQCEKHL